MSGQAAPPRSTQGDELIAAIRNNTAAVVAMTAAVGVLALAVRANTTATRELLEADDDADDEDDEVCENCEDPECDGECEPPRRRRR